MYGQYPEPHLEKHNNSPTATVTPKMKGGSGGPPRLQHWAPSVIKYLITEAEEDI